jgi:hypothetical protein
MTLEHLQRPLPAGWAEQRNLLAASREVAFVKAKRHFAVGHMADQRPVLASRARHRGRARAHAAHEALQGQGSVDVEPELDRCDDVPSGFECHEGKHLARETEGGYRTAGPIAPQ